MALTRHEESELRRIARSLWRDDPVLARALDSHAAWSGTAAAWLVLAPIVAGLLLAAGGEHWHNGVWAALGVVVASVAPVILSAWLSTRRR